MKTYTTIQGDMWDMIAFKTLGDESYTSQLIEANPGYRKTVIFGAGVVLTLPEVEIQTAEDLPPWKRT